MLSLSECLVLVGVGLTSLAAALHLAMATCCVVPWISGTTNSKDRSISSAPFKIGEFDGCPLPNASMRLRRVYDSRLTVDSLVRDRDPARPRCQDRLDFFQLVGISRDED